MHLDNITGFRHLAVRFLRRLAASDLTYQVQVSEDLVTWRDNTSPGPQPVTVEIGAQPAADFMETVTTRAAAPLTGASRLYMRVRIVKAP